MNTWSYTRELCISESDNSSLILPDSPLFDAGTVKSFVFLFACCSLQTCSGARALEINEFKMEACRRKVIVTQVTYKFNNDLA